MSGVVFFSLHRGNFHLSTAESSVAAQGELTQPPLPICWCFTADKNAPMCQHRQWTRNKNVFTLLVCFISSIDFLIERPQDLCYRAEQLCKKSSRVPEAFPMCPTGKNPRAGRAKSWFQALCREGSLVLCVHREMWLFLSFPGAWSSLGQWKIHGRIWKRWIKLSLPKFPWYCVHALLVHH